MIFRFEIFNPVVNCCQTFVQCWVAIVYNLVTISSKTISSDCYEVFNMVHYYVHFVRNITTICRSKRKILFLIVKYMSKNGVHKHVSKWGVNGLMSIVYCESSDVPSIIYIITVNSAYRRHWTYPDSVCRDIWLWNQESKASRAFLHISIQHFRVINSTTL